MLSRKLLSAGILTVGLFAAVSDANEATRTTAQVGGRMGNFQEIIQEAILNNPEVQASWHQLEASLHEQRRAKGGYYPSVDIDGEYGYEQRKTPALSRDSYERHDARLTITQLLFDGRELRNEVSRLEYAKRANFYALKEESERIALETAQAYLDVRRYQILVKLAEDNFVEHKRLYDKVRERTEAGIDKSVDLEQANARLALAEFNLLQDVTNLHDVSARFQRLVNRLPEDNLTRPVFGTGLIPAAREQALEQAFVTSPIINGSTETLISTQQAYEGRKAPFMPRFDLRLREEYARNTDGLLGRFHERGAEVVMTYNLYRGGADKAARKQFYKLVQNAEDLRVKACYDVRQTLLIAHNDIGSIEEKLIYLSRNEVSISKARLAYREQFDIGKRTLLDLLDSENEYFDVRRSLVSAQQDLLLAQVRTLAAMGLLVESMSLNEVDSQLEEEINLERTPDQANYRCPVQYVENFSDYKEGLLGRLRDRADGALVQPTTYRLDVHFEFDSDVVDTAYDKDFTATSTWLRENPEIRVKIIGHTDWSGSDAYNMQLSKRRAAAVRRVFIEQHGIDGSRIESEGRGESEPIDTNETAAGRAQNRRVELEPLN